MENYCIIENFSLLAYNHAVSINLEYYIKQRLS